MRSAKQGVTALMTSRLANNAGPKVRVKAFIDFLEGELLIILEAQA